ncbi:MAG: glycoside hydrolase family 27 protein [Bacteroidales bacterium]|nr:glycoside hydrolase family 27 protein [Candidatus Physcousia equi]
MKRLTHLFLALLATIGWSSGAWAETAANLNTQIANKISATSYQAGKSFSLQLKLCVKNAGSRSVLALTPEGSDRVILYAQNHQYLGLSVNGAGPDGWPDMVTEASTKTNTLTLASGATKTGWFSRNKSNANATHDFSSGALITIEYDQAQSLTTIKLGVEDGWSDIVKIEGLQLNANDIKVLQDDADGKTSAIRNFWSGSWKTVTNDTPGEWSNVYGTGTGSDRQRFANLFFTTDGTQTEVTGLPTAADLLAMTGAIALPLVTDGITLTGGKRTTISWTDAGSLSYDYIHAFIDADGDGTFETSLGTVGTAGGQNIGNGTGTISFSVPSPTETLNTRIRIRIDGAWYSNVANLSATANTNRLVYDVPVTITPVSGVQKFIDGAIAGTENLNGGSLSINDGGRSTITSNNGTITINNTTGVSAFSPNDTSRPVTTVSFRINLSTPTQFTRIFTLSSDNVVAGSGNIGLGMTNTGKLKTTWQGGEYNEINSFLSAGTHIITVVVGQSDNTYGTRVYIDDLGFYSQGGLKTSNKTYKNVIFDPAYSAAIDAVYVFNTAVTTAEVATIKEEISNIERQIQSKDITFNVYDAADHSRLFYTQQNVAQVIGSAPSLAGLPSYVTATYDVNAISAETTEVNAYTSATLPFNLNQDYTMKLRNFIVYSDGNTAPANNTTNATAETVDNYKWQVRGNWYDGFTFYNVGQQKSVVLNDANDASATFAEQGTTFEYAPNGNNICFKIKGSTNSYINEYGDHGKLSIWKDNNAASNAGSYITFSAPLESLTYGLFSAGMPDGAEVTIKGQTFTGLNAQAGNNLTYIGLPITDKSDVSVSVGNGYGYITSVDNTNKQVSVDFYPLFNPASVADVNNITDDEKEAATQYYLKDPGINGSQRNPRFVKIDGDNIRNSTNKAEADKFIFIQSEADKDLYYIYDVTAGQYIYYTQATSSRNEQNTSGSVVKFTNQLSSITGDNAGATWKFVVENAQMTVDIIPASGSTMSWNYRGGTSFALNLYNKDDNNSSWTILDSSKGALECATLVFAKKGAPFMHKIVPESPLTVSDANFDNITAHGGNFELKDRSSVGNHYKYVSGTAPTEEGEYTYTIILSDNSRATVKLVVDDFMQSPTPMMGWLTWNWFARAISHDALVDIAQGLQDKQLAAAGYKTIVIDDCWAKPGLQNKEDLQYDPAKFPQGILGLKTAVREINPEFKLGIYSDAGSHTCDSKYQPGSFGVEQLHVDLFDSYGIDMLKYDRCNAQGTDFEAYSQMGSAIKALNQRRRSIAGAVPFVFNACEWGHGAPWKWAAEAGASSWRSTDDVREAWAGLTNPDRPGVLIATDETRDYWMYAGVNRYNDLDMMCIGLHGLGGPSNATGINGHGNNGVLPNPLTDAQARSQMSLWCMFASPLAITADVRLHPAAAANTSAGTLPDPLLTEEDLATLRNADMISINQDALGQQAEYMRELSHDDALGTANNGGYTVYVKDLVDGEMALAVVNRGGAQINQGTITIAPSAIYLDGTKTIYTKNIWKKTFGEIAPGAKIEIPELAPYETCVLKLRTTASYEAEVVTITDAGAATYYFPKRVSIPDGVQAKYLTAAEANATETQETGIYALTYKRHEGEIPAGSAVVLVGDPGEYEFPYVTSSTEYVASATSSNDNLLFGYAEGEANASKGNQNAGLYALAKPANYALGFYPFVGERFKPKKAYLDATALDLNVTDGLVKGFMIFEDEDNKTTDIEGLKDEQGKQVIYDLMGRRLAAPVKGINIINGKKFIIQ